MIICCKNNQESKHEAVPTKDSRFQGRDNACLKIKTDKDGVWQKHKHVPHGDVIYLKMYTIKPPY